MKPISLGHVNDSEAYFTGEVQLVNYLVATGKPVDLFLDFGERKIEIKRNVKDLNYVIDRMEKISCQSCLSCLK